MDTRLVHLPLAHPTRVVRSTKAVPVVQANIASIIPTRPLIPQPSAALAVTKAGMEVVVVMQLVVTRSRSRRLVTRTSSSSAMPVTSRVTSHPTVPTNHRASRVRAVVVHRRLPVLLRQVRTDCVVRNDCSLVSIHTRVHLHPPSRSTLVLLPSVIGAGEQARHA